jgi:HK97 family phage portal protein
MGFWSAVADFARRRAGDDPDAADDRLFGEWEDGGLSHAGVPVNTTTAMRHVVVMACVSILAEDVAKIPLGVFRRLPNGGKEPARDHYLHRLLREPNDWQTALEFKEMLTASLVLRGNGYAAAVRNKRGEPIRLVPLHPDRVGLYEAPDGAWFYWVTRTGLHEMAVLRELPLLIPSEDVLHLRWLSQWNSLLGSSRLSMIRESVGLGMGLEEHQSRFVGQGARTSGALETDQKFASKEAREQIRNEWKTLMSGPRNSGAVAVLEQGLKWQPLGLTMVDSQFIESRNFQIRDIARAFSVPPYKLAIEGEAEGPAMVQMGQQYLNGPISGYCERWKAKGEKFFELDGEDVFLDWDYAHFLKADLMSRYTSYRNAVGGPWMSVDEARAAEGLASVPGGDTVLQATNMAPLGWTPPAKSTSQPGSDQTGSPGQGGDGDPERNPAEDTPAPGG